MGVVKKHLKENKLQIDAVRIVELITRIFYIKFRPNSIKFNYLIIFKILTFFLFFFFYFLFLHPIVYYLHIFSSMHVSTYLFFFNKSNLDSICKSIGPNPPMSRTQHFPIENKLSAFSLDTWSNPKTLRGTRESKI